MSIEEKENKKLKKHQKQARALGFMGGLIGFNYGFMKINQIQYHPPSTWPRRPVFCNPTLMGAACALLSAVAWYAGYKIATSFLYPTSQQNFFGLPDFPLKKQHNYALIGGFVGFKCGFASFNRYRSYQSNEFTRRFSPTLFRAYTAGNVGAGVGAFLFYRAAKKLKLLPSYRLSIKKNEPKLSSKESIKSNKARCIP